MKEGLCPDMPMMVNDWLSSTRIAVMSPAQEGAFLRLLLCAWNEPDCTLPDDAEMLAELSRLRADWPILGPKVRACFVTDPQRPGRIFNEKQRSVRKAQTDRVNTAKLHAKKAADARWGRITTAMPEHRASIAHAMPEHSSCNASYSAPGSPDKADKAYSTLSSSKPGLPKLTKGQKELADLVEASLGVGWANDAGKWVNRIKGNKELKVKAEPALVRRVFDEVEAAKNEKRITTTPAAYAEDCWKRFK